MAAATTKLDTIHQRFASKLSDGDRIRVLKLARSKAYPLPRVTREDEALRAAQLLAAALVPELPHGAGLDRHYARGMRDLLAAMLLYLSEYSGLDAFGFEELAVLAGAINEPVGSRDDLRSWFDLQFRELMTAEQRCSPKTFAQLMSPGAVVESIEDEPSAAGAPRFATAVFWSDCYLEKHPGKFSRYVRRSDGARPAGGAPGCGFDASTDPAVACYLRFCKEAGSGRPLILATKVLLEPLRALRADDAGAVGGSKGLAGLDGYYTEEEWEFRKRWLTMGRAQHAPEQGSCDLLGSLVYGALKESSEDRHTDESARAEYRSLMRQQEKRWKLAAREDRTDTAAEQRASVAPSEAGDA